MKITAFSMTPLYPDRVMGGAQKQLKKVVMYLADAGHAVTVLCTQHPPDLTEPFQWHRNARVVPIFRFKQPYPEPYATPIYNIANAIQDLGAYLDEADVFYSHDGGFIFPYIYQTIPTVTSLRSLLFSETLQSAFLFQGDALILISQFQRDTILATVGRFFPELRGRTHVIYNGLNFDQFRPKDAHEIFNVIPDVDPAVHRVALFPHRPEASKGIFEVIDVARRLVQEYNIGNLRVLVPRWIEAALSTDDRVFYDELTGRIEAHGLTEHFVFHEWVPQSLMPELYSLGDVTFAIGGYVETFGNVPYESLACGTPAILARVGPARELLPDALVDKIDPGDTEAAARVAARILRNREPTTAETMTYLKAHFQQGDMVQQYADVILQAAKQGPMPYVHPSLDETTQFGLAPWVYRTQDGRLYNDFRAEYAPAGVVESPGYRMQAYRAGWLVPVWEGGD